MNQRIRVASPIDEKMKKIYLRLFGYLQRRVTNAPMRMNDLIQVERTK